MDSALLWLNLAGPHPSHLSRHNAERMKVDISVGGADMSHILSSTSHSLTFAFLALRKTHKEWLPLSLSLYVEKKKKHKLILFLFVLSLYIAL